jgi:hypothetical protein
MEESMSINKYQKFIRAFKEAEAFAIDGNIPKASDKLDDMLAVGKQFPSDEYHTYWMLSATRYLLSELRMKINPTIMQNFEWFAFAFQDHFIGVNSKYPYEKIVEFGIYLLELASLDDTTKEFNRRIMMDKLTYGGAA